MKIAIIAFSTNGCSTSLKIKNILKNDEITLACKTTSDTLGIKNIEGKTSVWVSERFIDSDAIIFVGSIGIAVRYIAPFVKSKTTDPAIVCLDELGRFTVPILSGHIGGANKLANKIAEGLNSTVVITTATDINSKFSVDVFAVENNLRIMSMSLAKDCSARILDGRFIGMCSEYEYDELPNGLTKSDRGEFGICISQDKKKKPFDSTLSLIPMDVHLGIGCRKDTDSQKLCDFVFEILNEMNIDKSRICSINSIDLKSKEKAIIELSEKLRVPFYTYSSDELNKLEGTFSKSEFVNKITNVDCVCERSAMVKGKELIKKKTAKDGMTIAISLSPIKLRFLL